MTCMGCPRLSEAGLCSILLWEAGFATEAPASARAQTSPHMPTTRENERRATNWQSAWGNWCSLGAGSLTAATHSRGTLSWLWGGPRILHSYQALPGSTLPTSSVLRARQEGRAATPFPGQRREARHVRRFCVITLILRTGWHWPRSCTVMD